ncbi:MAG: hypothetical protein K2M60_01975 [Lachnospiraceae bacterium]|nr:hypothetical protein [Lachnospiraceae bacterium]MDE6254020.1 hypothetical protein [Lachnospiraceae bacterium]
MGKGNVVYHNIRMNLNNEQHRRVHSVLSELNTKVHKSVNQFLIDAADSYINRLAGNELLREKEQPEECLYVTREELEQIRRELKDELQREMIIILGSALTGGMSQAIQEKDVLVQENAEIETEADETTLGLASTWG